MIRNLPDIRTSYSDSSGNNICNSVVNDLRHGNYTYKSEVIYLEAGDLEANACSSASLEK